AEADQRTGESTDGASDTDARESRHDRTGSDERADARNGQRADSSEQAERAAKHRAGACSGGSAFRRFGGFGSADLPGAEIFGEQRGNIAGRKSGSNQRVSGMIRAGKRGVNSEDCGLFAGHV